MSDNKTPFIEITDLVKKFGTFTALNGVSLNVLPGEVHALLGCLLYTSPSPRD